MSDKKRLVTRGDFDGLVCAVILRELDIVDEIKFAHPKDVQDGKVDLSERDITANLPFDPRAGLVFDHHKSELSRLEGKDTEDRYINRPDAKSAARVVYDYYGGKKALPRVSEEMMDAVDKADSADFTLEEILHPEGWVLFNFLTDPRTGLGRFKDFRLNNFELMNKLADCCLDMSIEEILEMPDVKERADLYFEQQKLFIKQVRRLARVEDKVVVLDLRNEDVIYAGNRFMVYALYPEAEVSVHVAWGLNKQNTAVMIGKSIANKASKADIGELCYEYGGGGHRNAGTCQLDNDKVETLLPSIIKELNK